MIIKRHNFLVKSNIISKEFDVAMLDGSLTYNKTKGGLETDLLGTPDLTGSHSEKMPLTTTH